MLPAVSEDFLTSLLPFLLEGLGRGAGQDYRAATLMVVAELCSKATLGRDCIKGGYFGRAHMSALRATWPILDWLSRLSLLL